MVSMKTKAELVDEINALIGAVGDKFDAEEGDPERDYMVEHIPKRLEDVARRLPTLSMHLLAHIAEGPVSVVGVGRFAGDRRVRETRAFSAVLRRRPRRAVALCVLLFDGFCSGATACRSARDSIEAGY